MFETLFNRIYDGLVSELKKAGISEANQRKIKAKMYDFVSKFYIKRFSLMLENAKSLGILDSFNTELLSAVHKVGIVLSKMQKSWQKRLIDENSKFFKKNFKSIAKANEFIDKHRLYHKAIKCRSYLKKGSNSKSQP